MPDKPASPFQGLDRAMLRSTRPTPPSPAQAEPEVSRPDPTPKPLRTLTTPANGDQHVSMQASMHAIMLALLEQAEDLQAPGKEAITPRIPPADAVWLKEITHRYEVKFNRKLNQGLFLRIGIKVLQMALEDDPNYLDDLLKKIR